MINKDLLKKQASLYEIDIDDAMAERFDTYAEILVETNKVMNLTGITEPDEIVTKHFVDSIILDKYITIGENTRIADVGTGAGFPGLPLLILHPEADIVLIDALQKRLNFLQTVLDACGVNATLIHGRAEDLGNDDSLRETFDIVTARAVAPMNILSEYCLPFAKVGGTFAAMKGSDDDSVTADNAIATLGGEISERFSYNLPNGDGRNIILAKKISHTPTKYPRKNKKISSNPL